MTRKERRVAIRIGIAAALTLAGMIVPLRGAYRLAFLLPAYLLVGYDVLWRAVRNILHGQVFDESFLMSIATLGAFFVGEYAEASAVMLLYQLGELFNHIAVGKSRRSIAALMEIRPDTATVLRSDAETVVDPETVAPGETIIVRPGERIPLDGVIVSGQTSVDTAALTGESVPRDLDVGNAVVSGTVNLTGLIRVRTTSAFSDSTVSKILDLVENAAARKAKAESFITRFARVYTPCVVLAAVLLAAVPPLMLRGDWREWIYRALEFLVVSCPCALVISVPLTFFGGIGGASKRGILIKGSNYMEALAGVRTVAFDKTGTLTKGLFSVTQVEPVGMDRETLLRYAALAERHSTHPIARSVADAFRGNPDEAGLGAVTELSGLGIRAAIDGETVLVGNARLLNENGIPFPKGDAVGTTLYVAVSGSYAGRIVISDALKPDAADAIVALKRAGVTRTVLLTGDTEAVGESVGRELGFNEIHTGLLPQDKTAIVEQLLGERAGRVAFVGDGVNDAPVLARADVGIAMGALGSDAAIEAADVVLMDDRPKKVAEAMRIARRTMRIVRENIVFALGVKALVLLLSAFGLASMWIAVFADVGVCLLAVLNALRAMGVRK